MLIKESAMNFKKTDGRALRRFIIFMASIAILVLCCILSLRMGSVKYTTRQVWSALFPAADINVRNVVINIRLPRMLTAAMVGSNLAVAGALLQSVLRNPLADPGIIGVSAGAGLAAVTILLVFPGLSFLVPAGAFIGATAASFLVYILAWKRGVEPIRIVLSGVAVNAVLGGGISLLSHLYSDRIQGVLLWLNGSIAGKSWPQVKMLFPYTIIGLILSVFCIQPANALQLGDNVAKNLGIRVNRTRVLLCMTAAFLSGVSVAAVGLIGFVGLMVPHISRMLVGSDYRFMLPSSGIMGAALLVMADSVARSAFSPLELPVGIFMAVLGGPFFIFLLRKGGAYKA
ncbi:hemin transport system permease protein HmuU [Oxobacter pfennigii]|uniref:Hemin transport system permease protein HmuU n=2 Tax=Oxobacter pfennigii TaxID=36849 RepID=A0A0P8YXF7_9CLOT|nr:hemin transport system permease protein HmuU [Oxobacter pfennigii]